MSKQDRQGARTSADLEQKYRFGRYFSEQEKENARQNKEMDQQNMTLRDFISIATSTMDGLQKDLSAAQKTIQELQAKDKALEESDTSIKAQIAKYWETVYPVGSVYVSLSDESPASLFGGTWERLKDTFLLASGDTYAAGTTGGEAEHTLKQSEIPNYKIGFLPVPVMGSHSQWSNAGIKGSNASRNSRNTVTATSGTTDPQYGWEISTNGGSQPHNNMPPYTTVYVWKRTA